jgi:PKD repeat protein
MPLWDVRLTVTNAGGSDTKTRTGYVRANPVRTISDTGVSPSDSPARTRAAVRAFSDTGISFSEAVVAGAAPTLPAVTTRVAFATDPFSTTPTWTTIDGNRPLAFTIQRGRTSELDEFQAGTYDVTFDSKDRLFDPANTAGAYYGNLKPRKRINQRATIFGVTYDLFDGFANRWPQSFQGLWQQADVPATDAMGIFANATVTGSRGVEQTDQRLAWLLDQIGFPAGWRTSTVNGRMMLAQDYDAKNVLEAIKEVELAEGGQFFIDGAGNATFQARYDRATNYTASVVTFSDSPTGAELPFVASSPTTTSTTSSTTRSASRTPTCRSSTSSPTARRARSTGRRRRRSSPRRRRTPRSSRRRSPTSRSTRSRSSGS